MTSPIPTNSDTQNILFNISKNYQELSSLFAQLSQVSQGELRKDTILADAEVSAPDAKKKKIERDPLLPKKPMNAYLFYCRDNRDKIHNANPEIVEKEIIRLLGEGWKNLNDVGRKPYDAKALKVKEEYTLALAAYKTGTIPSPSSSTNISSSELSKQKNIPSTTSDLSVSEPDISSQDSNVSSSLKLKKKKDKEGKKEKKEKKKYSQELSINA